MRLNVRRAIRLLAPRGYAELKARRGREYVLAMRDRRIATARASLESLGTSAFSVEESARFLTGRGLDADEVLAGSMPQESLDYVGSFLVSELPDDRPLHGLHIGNFVGVSLACLSGTLRAMHPGSQVVSIDPNIPHRGVVDPAGHAFALLGHFGLLDCNVVITGYTLEQNVGDDTDADPIETFVAERRPEYVLRNLTAWAHDKFDVVFMDGNHDGRYPAREIEQLMLLLRPGALIVLDDVDETVWPLVAQTFDELSGAEGFEELGRDGRVGVLRVKSVLPSPAPKRRRRSPV